MRAGLLQGLFLRRDRVTEMTISTRNSSFPATYCHGWHIEIVARSSAYFFSIGKERRSFHRHRLVARRPGPSLRLCWQSEVGQKGDRRRLALLFGAFMSFKKFVVERNLRALAQWCYVTHAWNAAALVMYIGLLRLLSDIYLVFLPSFLIKMPDAAK